MKRLLCIILTFSLLACFTGCDESSDSTVSFCYLRSEYTLGGSDSVLLCEQRDMANRPDTLDHILGVYLNGPLDEQLVSPFPAGTSLVSSRLEDGTLTLELSDSFASLDGIRLTLAAGCLAHTCFGLTDADTLCIRCGGAEMVLTRDSLTLLDDCVSSADSTQPTN